MGAFGKIAHYDYRSISLAFLTCYLVASFAFSDFGISAIFGAVLLSGFTLICVIQCVREREAGFSVTLASAIALAFFGFVLINSLRNGSPDRTHAYYLIVLCCAVALLLVGKRPSDKVVRASSSVVLLAAVSISLLNVAALLFPIQFFELIKNFISESSLNYNYRLASGGYGFSVGESISYTGLIIVLGLFVATFKLLKGIKPSGLLVALVCWIGLIALQRRGELLCCVAIVCVIGFGWYLVFRRKQGGRHKADCLKVAVVEVLCFVVAFMFVGVLSGESRLADSAAMIGESLSSSGKAELSQNAPEESGLSNGRLVLWNLAFEGFEEEPLLGNGWGSFSKIASASGNIHVTNAHNIYLQLLFETGMLGFAIFGAGIVLLIRYSVSLLVESGNVVNKKHALFFLAVLLFVMLEGLVDNTLYYVYDILALFASLMLIAYSAQPERCALASGEESLSGHKR